MPFPSRTSLVLAVSAAFVCATPAHARFDASPLSADGRARASTVVGLTERYGMSVYATSGVAVTDRLSHETERISTDAEGQWRPARAPAMDWSGRVVAFESAQRLMPSDRDTEIDIYVRDRDCSVPERIAAGRGPSLSADGRWVAFMSSSPLVAADTNRVEDVYLFDRGSSRLVRLTNGRSWDDAALSPVISGDGRRVAFHTSSQLTPDDTDRWSDLYVKTLSTGALTRVGKGSEPALSFDGSVVAFTHESTVWVFDGSRSAVMRTDGHGSRPSLSADGSRVAFVGSPTGQHPSDIWTYDRERAVFQPAGVAPGTELANAFVHLSADGAWVSGNNYAFSATMASGFPAAAVPPVQRWSNPCPAVPERPPYKVQVLADNPLAYWRLGEPRSAYPAMGELPFDDEDARDETGRFHALRFGWPEGGAPGALEGDQDFALHLDGLVTSIGHTSLEVTDREEVLASADRKPFSLEAWLKPKHLNHHTRRVFSSEREDDTGGYLLGARADGIVFSRYRSGRWNTLRAPLPAGRWSHVVATYDGVTMRLFVDGVERSSGASLLALPDGRTTFRLGSLEGRWKFYAGDIDEAAVYDRALPAARVAAHHRFRR